MSATQYGATENLYPTLGAVNPTAVAFAMRGREDGAVPEVHGEGDTAGALRAASGGSTRDFIAWSIMPQNSGKDYKDRAVDVAQPIMAGGPVGGNQGGDYIQDQWAVRRLTPRECERLQGYPDGWTLIEHGSRRTVEQDEADYLTSHGAHVVEGNDGKLRTNAAADGPRYKALGNAWAVACVRPIALGIYERAITRPRIGNNIEEVA
jgi:site-specific DNA-cytosine methylase